MRQTKGKIKMCGKKELQTEVRVIHGLSSAESAVHERLVMLPCPWCGCTEVSIEVSEIGSVLQYSAHAHCAECYAGPPDGSGVVDSVIEAKKLALNAWNDREI